MNSTIEQSIIGTTNKYCASNGLPPVYKAVKQNHSATIQKWRIESGAALSNATLKMLADEADGHGYCTGYSIGRAGKDAVVYRFVD